MLEEGQQGEEVFEFTVDGKPFKGTKREVENMLAFSATTTQRAQEVAERERRLQAEQQAAERRLVEREAALLSTVNNMVERVAPPPKPETQLSLHDQVRPHLEALPDELVSDGDAPQKLRQNITAITERIITAQESGSAALVRQLQQQMGELEAKLTQKLEAANRQTEVTLTRNNAATEAQKRNDRVFEEALASEELSRLNLSRQELETLKTKALTTYSDDLGKWDPAAKEWLITPKGVISIARSMDSVYEKMQAAATASARGEGLQARIRGRDASNSTPNRSRPALGAESEQMSDSEFIAKIEFLNEKARRNPKAASEIMAAMSDADWKRLDAIKAEQAEAFRTG